MNWITCNVHFGQLMFGDPDFGLPRGHRRLGHHGAGLPGSG